MNGRRVLTLAAVVLVVSLIAVFARHGRSRPIAPPDLVYGQDVCAQCNMIISDQRFAAALVVREADGQQATHAFDDIGCAIGYQKQHAGEVLARYIADYGSKQWLDADKAIYVRGGQITSPMGYGAAACRDRQAGLDLSKSLGGDLLDYPTLQARISGSAADVQAAGMTKTAEHDHP